MHYKTIIHELLQEQYPTLHARLCRERSLLAALNRYATELRDSHFAWMEELRRASPQTDQAKISSEALELALENLQGSLPPESSTDDMEAISIDALMASILPHTPPA
jgi:hypothetical protein